MFEIPRKCCICLNELKRGKDFYSIDKYCFDYDSYHNVHGYRIIKECAFICEKCFKKINRNIYKVVKYEIKLIENGTKTEQSGEGNEEDT